MTYLWRKSLEHEGQLIDQRIAEVEATEMQEALEEPCNCLMQPWSYEPPEVGQRGWGSYVCEGCGTSRPVVK